MLYTFSKSQYDPQQLAQLFAAVSEQDAVLLWQDGVILPIKYPTLFQKQQHYFLLENDLVARGLQNYFSTHGAWYSVISLYDVVKLTEEYFPQINL